jgi:hypothetical protein
MIYISMMFLSCLYISVVKILRNYVLYDVFSSICVFGAVFQYTNHSVVAHCLNIYNIYININETGC